MEMDNFGIVIDNVMSSHEYALRWYVIYTALSFLFFLSSLVVCLYNDSRVAVFYASWILLNMFVSGLSAIFQAYETNSMLIVYNVLQNLNLVVDIMAVILGTDTKVKGSQYVRDNADRVYTSAINLIRILIKKSNRF